MKKLLLAITFLFCNLMFAQPTILFTGLNSTTPSPSNNRYVLENKTIFKQYRFQANQSVAASTTGWAFHIGSTAFPDYSANWRASSGGNTLFVNAFVPAGFSNGANYTNNGGTDGLLPAITSGNYYTFNVEIGGSTASVPMGLLETTYNPTALLSQSVVVPLASNGSGKIIVNAAAALNTGEYVYMRYSNSINFTTSTLIEVPFVGASGTISVPCFAPGATIYYYFFSSNKTKSTIDTEYGNNGNSESVYDMSTLNLLNNSGPNYTYVQPAATPAADFTGNYYIPSNCYGNLQAFLTAFNAGNLIGPVTVNIAAGYNESTPAGGFQITKTGTSSNQIIFKKDGVGVNPTFTASGTPSIGTLNDAIFKIIGADFVTLDGLTIKENSANVNFIANSTNNMTEFGVALFYNTTTDGAQNNTIQNCDISLNKNYTNTFGIYSNTNHDRILATTAIASLAGGNNKNKVYSNTISNVNIAVAFVGTNAFYDADNDIGGNSSATGNIITNQGSNVAPVTSYPGMPGTSVISILVGNCTGSNISYNNITGTTCANNNYGIQLRNNGTSPTLTHTTNINNNTISGLASSATTSYNLFGIWNDSMGGANHTLNINNNSVTGLSTSNAGFVGAVNGIWSSGAVNTLNINSNTISGFTIAGGALPTATTARCGAIKSSGIVTGAINISTNAISNFAFNNTGVGDIVMLDVNGNYTGTCAINNNTVNVVSTTGTGSIFGYLNTGSPTGALTISNNTFKDINITGTGTSSLIKFVRSSTGASQNITVRNNLIEKLRVNPAIASTGITAIEIGTSNIQNIYENTITDLVSGVSNYGINSSSGGTTTLNVYGNNISKFSSTALTTFTSHRGIETSASANIYNNKITDISSDGANPIIYAIRAFGGTTNNIYNNFISDLKTPASGSNTFMSIQGIRASGTTNNVYNNSVYLKATSTATDFGTACFAVGSGNNADLRNNIFVNESTAKGVQYSATILNLSSAYPTGTVPANILTTSNNNCLYATGYNSVIYKDVENMTNTQFNIIPANCFDLTAYKTYMTGGRETASFSEIPPFVNITPTTMDLHLNTATGSGCFNNGATIALVTNDIDNVARPIGGIYDIGADEAAGTLIPRIPPTIAYTPIADLGCSAAVTLTATITTPGTLGSGANAPRLYYKKLSDSNFNFATANTNAVSGWKFVTATGSGPFNFAINYSLLAGGFVSGDTLQYFVAAQDTNNNVAITNANVQTCPNSVVFTAAQIVSAPPTINQFAFKASYSGAYTVGTAGNFATLTGANGLFDSINKGLVAGNVTATIISDIAETGTIALNEWSEYDTVNCLPIAIQSFRLSIVSDGTTRTISGTDLVYNATTLKSLINLNGADRVTFNGGTLTDRKLVFRSTNVTSTSCVPVFQMGNVNGSNNIIIKNCDIQTNSTSISVPFGAGILVTGIGTNINNLFQLNDIHNSTAGTIGNPRFGIYAETNTSTVLEIKDNNIYNIFNKAIKLGATAMGSGQKITGNSIYYNTGNINSIYAAIELNAGAAASGHTISNNFIGGASPLGGTTGNAWTTNSISAGSGGFKGISIGTNGTTNTTLIENNYIGNLNFNNAGSTAPSFTGIDFTGNVTCQNNTIGHNTDPAMGVKIGATGQSVASNNYCISANNIVATTAIIKGNIIKNISHITNSTSVSRLHAITLFTYPAGSTVNIESNTIANITSNMKSATANAFATTLGANSGSNVIGILSTTANGTLNISDNNINNLSNTELLGTNTPSVLGIAIDGATTNSILRNKIYGLTNESPGSAANPASTIGIRLFNGVNTVANNMVTITNGSFANASRIVGIWDNNTGAATSSNIFFNSVYIGGSQTAGGTGGLCSSAFSLVGSTTGGVRNLKNNIFVNARTGGTSGTGSFHYTIAVPTTATGFLSNYNDLVGSDATNFCFYNTTSHTLATWQALATPTTPDVNSLQIVPSYLDLPNGDLHIVPASVCSTTTLPGTPIATVLNDYDLTVRNITTPSMGAHEFGSPAYTWTGSWSPSGFPNINSAVTINANYDMTSLPSIDACTLTIGNGSNAPIVSVTSGKYINIQNDLTTNVGATLNILDKGSLIMINDAGNVTNNGTTNVSRLTPSFDQFDYTYWSAPVENPQLGTSLAAWNLTQAFTFATANFSDRFNNSAYPVAQTTGIPDSFDDDYNDWTAVSSSTPMAAGVGYAVMGNATAGTPNTTETVSFSGKVNNGLFTYPMSLSANNLANDDDYNLVGNPYPSSIKADDFIKANILPLGTGNNITGTLYFWSHKGNLAPAMTNPGPNTQNYNNNDYASYNLTGATGTGTSSGSGSATPDGFIGTGQGFFVEAEIATNLVFRNSLRSKNQSNSQFFRANNDEQKDRLWLNFQNVDNMFSQQLIGYLPETTIDYDYGYDGIESKSQNYVSFYSFMNGNSNANFKIQSRDAFDNNDFVKLGFFSAVSGQSSISIDRFEGVFDNQNIYLQDNLLNITHDLKQAPYNFTTNYGTFNERFVLKYVNTSLANSTFVDAENVVKIAVKDSKISIASNNEYIKSIQVFDILGRNIYDNQSVNSKTFSVDNLLTSNQVFIVRIKLESGELVSKKIVLQ